MQRFKNVLAVVDTSFDQHPALARAANLARANQAQLDVVDVVPHLSWPATLGVPNAEAIRRAVIGQKAKELERLIEPLRVAGIHATSRVLCGKTSQEIIREVERARVDLVLRVTKGRRSRRAGLLGTTSLQLLRYCPCPVWLVRPEQPDRLARIVAGVDASAHDETHQALNKSILELAASLCAVYEARLEIVYAWSIYGENVLREQLQPEEFVKVEAQARADQEQALDRLLSGAGVEMRADNVHLLRGDPSTEIPKFVEQTQADLIVLGTVARSGIAGFFIGNTSERILDKVHCSILAVKPENPQHAP